MDDELQKVASSRREAGELHLPLSLQYLQFYSWIIRGVVAAVVIMTMFIGRTQIKMSEYDRMLLERGERIEKLDAYITSNNLANQSNTNTVESIRERLKRLEDWREQADPKITEMFFLKAHGSNGRGGFISPAPKLPQIEPDGPPR